MPKSIQVLGATKEPEASRKLYEALRAPENMQARRVWFREVYPQSTREHGKKGGPK